MKSLLLITGFTLALLVRFVSAQNFTFVNSTEHQFQANDVLVAVSPSGDMYRADEITTGLGGIIDTLRIFSFDVNGNPSGSTDIYGFVNHAAMEADNSRIYLNLEVNNVQTYPVSLPGIGIINTGGSIHGSLFVAFSQNLQVEWFAFFGADFYNGFWQSDITFLQNGNLLFNTWEDHPDFDLFVKFMEYTPDGNFVSEFSQTELVYTMKEDSQGNLYVTGPCANDLAVFNGTEVPFTLGYNFYIVKYDIEHNYIWSNFVEDVTCPFTDLAVNAFDEVFLYAPLLAGDYFFDDIPLQVSSTLHYVIAKLDSEGGNFQWVKPLSEGIAGGNSLTNIIQNSYVNEDPSGNMLVCGSVQGEVTWNNGQEYSSPKSKPFVALVKNDGIIEWVNVAVDVLTFGKAHHIDWSESGCLVMGGTGVVFMQLDTIEINHDGFFSYLARLQLDNPGTGLIAESSYDFSINPNPACGQIYINPHFIENDSFYVSISNLSGEKIYEKQFHKPDRIVLETTSFSPGFYLVNLQGNGTTLTKKLIIN